MTGIRFHNNLATMRLWPVLGLTGIGRLPYRLRLIQTIHCKVHLRPLVCIAQSFIALNCTAKHFIALSCFTFHCSHFSLHYSAQLFIKYMKENFSVSEISRLFTAHRSLYNIVELHTALITAHCMISSA